MKIAAQISSLSIMTHTLMSLVSVNHPISQKNEVKWIKIELTEFILKTKKISLACRLACLQHGFTSVYTRSLVVIKIILSLISVYSRLVTLLSTPKGLQISTATSSWTHWRALQHKLSRNRFRVGHVSKVQDRDRESGYREHVRTPVQLVHYVADGAACKSLWYLTRTQSGNFQKSFLASKPCKVWKQQACSLKREAPCSGLVTPNSESHSEVVRLGGGCSWRPLLWDTLMAHVIAHFYVGQSETIRDTVEL